MSLAAIMRLFRASDVKEEINAKVAELVNREFRELIEANVIETNLRLQESQLHTRLTHQKTVNRFFLR
jgi:hypothetical protein